MPLITRLNSFILTAALLVAEVVLGQSSSASDPAVDFSDNRTPTWQETVAAFESLAELHPLAHFIEVGMSDVGRPIHAFILSDEGGAIGSLDELRSIRGSNVGKLGLLVNNAIHPGEPCGVDASVAWLRELMGDDKALKRVLETMDIAVIPMYNVGGALNRNCCTRTNQDGPEEYGFRGNARNLDLNRDFIKMDSRNAFAFVDLFQAFAPDVFIDTHTTNGADYPYEMTLIATQPDKAGPVIGPFIRNEMGPALYASMDERSVPMSPYVYSMDETPESGIRGFLETPRYSTGYGVLFGAIGFTAEAHMLKPFPVRVHATKQFIESIVSYMVLHTSRIRQIRQEEKMRWENATEVPVRWGLTDTFKEIEFQGYASRKEVSPVTGELRLKYDRTSTWERAIPYYNEYDAVQVTTIPTFWVIPQAWREVIERLRANGVHLEPIPTDTTMALRVGEIKGFQSSSRPYEGHHMNKVDEVQWEVQSIQLFAGDFVVPADQAAVRFLCEVLDPQAHDSYFTWNFFDSAMQQKEHFSAYVFEETARDMLEGDSLLRMQFEMAVEADESLKNSASSQLNWLYRASKHYEGTVNRYPVYKSLEDRQ